MSGSAPTGLAVDGGRPVRPWASLALADIAGESREPLQVAAAALKAKAQASLAETIRAEGDELILRFGIDKAAANRIPSLIAFSGNRLVVSIGKPAERLNRI